MSDDRLLRIKEVAKMFGVAPQTIRNWIKQKQFPDGKRLSERIVVWQKSEINKYIEVKQ